MREQKHYTMILNNIDEVNMYASCIETEMDYPILKINRPNIYHMSIDGISFGFYMSDEQIETGVCSFDVKQANIVCTLYTQAYYDEMVESKEECNGKQFQLGSMKPVMAK